MLPQDWSTQFGQLAESCIQLLKEAAEMAYKQGSVLRLGRVVRFLLKHGKADDGFLIKLAEAGIKTNSPSQSQVALTELVLRYPNQLDYSLHLSNVLTSLGQYQGALDLISQMPVEWQQVPDIKSQRQATEGRLRQRQQLERLVVDILEGSADLQLSGDEFESHGQTILQTALDLNEKDLVTRITAILVQRLQIEESLLIQLAEGFTKDETNDGLHHFVKTLSREGRFPHLIRFYLEWLSNRGKKVPDAKALLKSLKPDQGCSDCLDVLALLLALVGDWPAFISIADKALSTLTKPPALLKYAIVFWLKTNQHSKVAIWVEKADLLTVNELRFIAAGLEVDGDYIQTRLRLLQLAQQKNPNDSFILNDLGDAQIKLGEQQQGVQSFYQSIQKAEAETFHTNFNLAITLQAIGDSRQAFDYFKRALAIDPDNWHGWKYLCEFMISTSSWQLGYDSARFYLASNPSDSGVWNQLAHTALKCKQLANARDYVQEALRLAPTNPLPQTTLGLIEMACGNITKAFEANREVLMSAKVNDKVRRGALSAMLFCGNYDPDKSAEQLYNIYRAVTSVMPKQKYFPEVANYQSRKIRIGYVSADFKHHPVAFFLEALLKHHDRSTFEIYAYSGVGVEDDYTELFKKYVDHWHYIGKTSDYDVAELIIDHAIDVLVDLSGHTNGHRLEVFALKPCAVQVSWLGFAHTTGLRQMDYFLGDHELTPEFADQYFSEQPYRLPRTSYCFTPNIKFRDFEPNIVKKTVDAPLVLGNLGRAIRFNTPVLNLWKQVLEAVPNSVIKIDSPNFADQESIQMMRERFLAHGIPEHRFSIGYTEDYWQSIVDIDIALDGFPQNSGTTLFEFLWCGTPVVTLKDRPSVGRLGAMVLHGAGCDEWIADTPEQYVEIISKLTADRDALHETRCGLRQKFLDSELCDGADFAKAVEDAYVEMLKQKKGLPKPCTLPYAKQTDLPSDLLSEQIELAYKQGCINRLQASIKYLEVHEGASQQQFTYLAEAGLKTNRPEIAEYALQQLLREDPDNNDYQRSLVDVLCVQSRFEEALNMLSKMTDCNNSSVQAQKVQVMFQQQQEIRQTIFDVLTHENGVNLDGSVFFSLAQTTLQAAINISDFNAVIDVCCALLKRDGFEDEALLIEVYNWLSSSYDGQHNIQAYIQKICQVRCVPSLIRHYLAKVTHIELIGSVSSNLSSVLDSVEGKKHFPELMAVLFAANSNWKAFEQVIDAAITAKFKPPLFYRYAASYWLENHQSEKLDHWRNKAEYLSEAELLNLADGLAKQNNASQWRFELVRLAHWKYPERWNLLLDLARAEYRMGQTSAALSHLNTYFAKHSQSLFDASFTLGCVLLANNMPERAVASFKMAVAYDPNQLKAWMALVCAHIDSTSWQDASDTANFGKSIQQNAFWPLALAFVATQRQQEQEAIQQIEAALSIVPDLLERSNLNIADTNEGLMGCIETLYLDQQKKVTQL